MKYINTIEFREFIPTILTPYKFALSVRLMFDRIEEHCAGCACNGFHSDIPDDFSQIVAEKPMFNAFFPLQSALNQGLLSVVSNVPVADCNKEFPMFRTREVAPDGQCGPWWIWDGENEEMLERELNPTEKLYSYRGIISAPLLVERIEKGYRPEVHDV